MCSVFAASFPQRTSALVMYGSYAKRVWDPEYPWAPTPEERERWYTMLEQEWGSGADVEILAPNADERFRDWWSRYLRMSASPGAAVALGRMNGAIDIRPLLSAIRVPTLILHRTGDRDIDVGGSRWMAGQIAASKYVELPGDDHLPWVGGQDAILDEVEEFLTGVRRGPDPDRVLATILFTDIIDSTQRASELGDRGWRDLLEQHHRVVRAQLERYRGREIDNAGDGFCASFDGPARAIHCALAIREDLHRIGLDVRAGIHTGECEVLHDKLAGVAIHVAARIAASGSRGEVRVSGTVCDLVAGSGIAFQHLGPTALKGLPGVWQLLKVTS
jgi:class 3 adenylate cyclase